MSKKRQHRASRYDVSGNVEAQYVDARKRVLVNTKGIRNLRDLQHLEEDALATAYALLMREVRTGTPMTCDLLRHIHRRIFGDLYDWAGRWRTVQISKPGAAWPPPDFLAEAMREFERDVLGRYPAKKLRSDDDFCKAAAHIQGEFLAIHPFREGNARTIKLFTDVLALQTGRPLLRYDMSKSGQRKYIAAAKVALHEKDYGPMETLIQEALGVAIQAA